MAKKKSRRKNNDKRAKKTALVILLGFVLVLLAAYFAMTFYFSGHFFSGTRINGIDCGRKSVEDAKKLIADGIMEYQLMIRERDNASEVLTADQLGMEYVDDNKVEELMEAQNPYKWIISFASNKAYTVAANRTYNKEVIDSLMDRLNCFDPKQVVAPADAALEKTDSGYVITPEVEGNTLNRGGVKEAIIQAIENGDTEIDLEKLELYVKPAVRSTDEALANALAQINAMTKAQITYDFVDRTWVVDAEKISEWLVKDADGNFILDENQVGQFVYNMAYETDTYGQKRQFKTSLGTTVELKGGDYGWVINRDKTAAELIEKLRAGAVETIQPVYLYEGKDRSKDDIGGTYVEVSIEKQKMWCYKDRELVVETDVVTGRVSMGWDTPKGGVWAIDAKARNWHLTSEEYGYDTLVSYWLPFNGNVGIHDLNRTKWGGTVYINNGSHGCVNTPIENVEKIYNAVEKGTPVIVY